MMMQQQSIIKSLFIYCCNQWRSKGSKWGHVPWGAGLGGATAHF